MDEVLDELEPLENGEGSDYSTVTMDYSDILMEVYEE